MMTPCCVFLIRCQLRILCGWRAQGRWLFQLAALLALLLPGWPAQAATSYTFSPLSALLGTLPAGCSLDSFSLRAYSCGVLSLTAGDTITIDSFNKPVTITFSGAFTTGASNLINVDGATSDLTLITNGVLTLGASTRLNANVVGTAAVNLGSASTLTGNLTTTSTTGIVTLAADSQVGGFISTQEGAVTLGVRSTVGGAVSAGAGVVTLDEDVKVGGSISTSAGAVTVGGNSTVSGGISTGAGVVTLLTKTTIGGGITTVDGGITVGDASRIGGAITSTGAGIVTLGANINVAAGISTQAGAINIGTESVIGGSVSTQAGVVTLTTSITVKGDITTVAGGITVGDLSTICGNISSTGAGVLILTQGIKVGGSVTTAVGAITIGIGSTVGADVISGGVVTLTSILVGGNVRTGDGAITLTDSRVRGTVISTGGGVVTATGSVIGDTTLIVPAACTATPSTDSEVSQFECLETSLLPTWVAETSSTTTQHRLYTKLVEAPFSLDVVALKTDGTIQSNYVASGGAAKNVTVELVLGSGDTACADRAALSPAVTQTLAFSNADAGRKTTAAMTLAKAHLNVMCRVTDTTSTSPLVSCSSDQFSVRPSAATLLTTATATAPFVASAPVIKAGVSFALRATTNATDSYTNALALDTNKLSAQLTSQDATQQNGGVVGTLTPSSLTANADAVNATYSEVGYLYLAPGAYRDDSFTAIDSGAGDCITASVDAVNYLSDTLLNGQYGCSIGNKTSVSLGRFIPDHFGVTPGTMVNRVLAACTVASAYSYMGETMQVKNFLLTARNGLSSPAVTQNYAGVFARLEGHVMSNFGLGGVDLADATVPLTATAFAVGDSAGELRLLSSSGDWVTGVGTFSVNFQLNRSASPQGPYESFRVGILPMDADLVTLRAADKNLDMSAPADGVLDKVLIGSSSVRLGRLQLKNAYGSEKLPLPVALQAQYWTGSYFTNQTDDSCTALSVPAAQTLTGTAKPNGVAGLYFYPLVSGQNGLQSSAVAPIWQSRTGVTTSVLSGGQARLQFAAPGQRGWLDIVLSVPDYLRYDWGNCSGQTGAAGLLDDLPCARVSFGVYKSPLIYRRENY